MYVGMHARTDAYASYDMYDLVGQILSNNYNRHPLR